MLRDGAPRRQLFLLNWPQLLKHPIEHYGGHTPTLLRKWNKTLKLVELNMECYIPKLPQMLYQSITSFSFIGPNH